MARKSGNSAVLEADKPSKKAAAVVTLPIEYKGRRPPKLTPAEFWAATAAYPRNAVTCFKLYRLFPKIDRRLSGEELKDIADKPEMSEAGILSEFGSGEYQIYFIDGNRSPSSLCSTVLELTDDIWANPPVLNQKELIEGHPKNKGYIEGLKSRGQWKRDNQEDESAMAETAAATGAAAAAVTEMAGIAKSAMAKNHEQKPADLAVGEIVQMMGTAYKSALSTIGDSAGNKGGDSAMVALLIKQMEANEARAERQAKESEARAQRQHEAMLEMMKNQRPAAGGSIDKEIGTVDKLLAFAEKRGGNGGATSLMDRLPELLLALVPALINANASRAAAPPAAPQYPQYPPGPYVPPVATAAPVPAAPVNAAPMEVDDSMMPMILSSMGLPAEALPFAKALLKIAGRAGQMFRAGVSGYAFAADVERSEGEETFGLIWAAGHEELVGLLAKFGPMLGAENAAMVASPEFHSWLADFFAYGQQAGYAEDPAELPAGGEGAAQ